MVGLESFFSAFEHAPHAAWPAWARWRRGAGSRDQAYCLFTQEAVRWLRVRLTGQGRPVADWPLRQDHAARRFAELAHRWLTSEQGGDIAEIRAEIIKLVAGPREDAEAEEEPSAAGGNR